MNSPFKNRIRKYFTGSPKSNDKTITDIEKELQNKQQEVENRLVEIHKELLEIEVRKTYIRGFLRGLWWGASIIAVISIVLHLLHKI
jgi:hypothetical protein